MTFLRTLQRTLSGLRVKWLIPANTTPEAAWDDLHEASVTLLERGEFGEALPVLQRAIKLAKYTFGESHPNFASSLNDLGVVYVKAGKCAKAKRCLDSAYSIRVHFYVAPHLDLAESLHNFGMLHKTLDDQELCERHISEAIEMYKQLPASPGLAKSLSSLGILRREQKRLPESRDLQEQALAIAVDCLPPDQFLISTLLNNLGFLYKESSRHAEAEALLLKSISLREQSFGADHSSIAGPLLNLASLKLNTRNYGEAESFCKRAIRLRETRSTMGDPPVGHSYHLLGRIFEAQFKWTEAKDALVRATKDFRRRSKADRLKFAASLDHLANVTRWTGDPRKARSFAKDALAIREKLLPSDSILVAISLNTLAAASLELGQFDTSEPLLSRALNIWQNNANGAKDPPPPLLVNLALVKRFRGKFEEAESLYQGALELLRVNPDAEMETAILKDLADLHLAMSRVANG